MNYLEQSKAKPHGSNKMCWFDPTCKVHGGIAYLDLTGGMELDKEVIINTGVVIYTHNHHFGHADWRWKNIIINGIHIAEFAWIGRNAMIMPSVEYIGISSIIAPGSVVTKNIPDYEMWGGNPAKFIKKVIH